MTTEEVQTIHWFILIMRLSAVVSGQTSDDYRGGSDHPLVHPDHDAIVISGQPSDDYKEVQTIHWFILIMRLSAVVSGQPSDDYRGDLDQPLVHPDHETTCC